MASPASEASEIRRRGRQRLIGAIALVLLLVVFVPMLLDKEPGRSQQVPPIPSREHAPALPAPKAAEPAPKAAEAAPPPAPANTPAPDAKLSKDMPPVPPVASVKPVEPAPAKAPASPPKLEGFAVQVGAFRDEAKLNQAREKLAAAKIVHFTERLDSQGGALTRLRAGPFPTREAAESAQATLKRAGLDGKVVPLP
jgi:DedD protein